MAIHENLRIPPVEYIGNHSLNLRRFKFHGIPVKVKHLSVIPYADTIHRTILIGSVEFGNWFVAVGIEIGTDKEDYVVKETGMLSGK